MAESRKKTACSRKKNSGTKGRKKKKPVKQKKNLGFWLLGGGLFFLFVLILSVLLNKDRLSPPNMDIEVVSKKELPAASHPSLVKKIHPPKHSEALVAPPLSDLAAGIKEIDLAVLQTLVALGLSAESFEYSSVDVKENGQEDFCHQTFRLTVPVNSSDFERILRSNLSLVTGAKFQSATPCEFQIVWQGVPTHLICLAAAPEPLVPEKRPPALLVVIIDDIGESKEACQRLAALDFPVTLSVLPFTTHTKEAADFARQKKMELMLHLPCEPIGHPETADPGPGSLFVNMSDVKILELLRKDIAAVPGVTGVNNHMGSLFTQDERRMRVVLKELRKQNLFFLDSLTSSRSRVRSAAEKEGLAYIRRNIFLDNEQEQAAILQQLKKAQALAQKKGSCIAIGHPYPVTLAALEKWQGERDKSVLMTTVSHLLKEKEAKK